MPDGWPGYRTEGVYYTAYISLLNTSGKSVNEHMLLFRTPGSKGLKTVVELAKACQAKAGAAISGAQTFRFPEEGPLQQVLVVDQMFVIRVEAPTGLNIDKLIRSAVQRARSA